MPNKMEKKNPDGCEPRRGTRQKALILDCLKKTEGEHVTAEELLDRLKLAGTPVGKATVYRYLGELEDGSRVRRYPAPENGPACYQYLGENSVCRQHYHLLCGMCGNIVHFDSDGLEKVFKQLDRENGFLVDQTKTIFYGLCGDCTRTIQTVV